MARRLALLVIATMTWPASGLGQEPPNPKSDADRDAVVMEVVLQDILTRDGKPLEHRDKTKTKQLVFSPESRTGKLVVADVLVNLKPAPPRAPDPRRKAARTKSQIQSDNLEKERQRQKEERWNKLSPDQIKLVHQAAENLVARVDVKEPFKDFKPKDERIVIRGEDRKVENRFRGPQVFRAYAPGYSRDKQFAIIRVTFPWSGGRHSGEGTYLLERQGDKWVVLMCEFVYFV